MSRESLLDRLERVKADLRRPMLRDIDIEHLERKRQHILNELWELTRQERIIGKSSDVYDCPPKSAPVFPTGEEDFRCSMCDRLIGHPGHCWPCAREWELL